MPNYVATQQNQCEHCFSIRGSKIWLFTRLFVTLNKLLHLGIKNKRAYFVLRSTFRNFGFAEVTWHSGKRRKT